MYNIRYVYIFFLPIFYDSIVSEDKGTMNHCDEAQHYCTCTSCCRMKSLKHLSSSEENTH